LLTNISLGWEGLPRTNALAYLASTLATKKKSFYDFDSRRTSQDIRLPNLVPEWNSTYFIDFHRSQRAPQKKVLQFKMPFKSRYNKNLGFIEQKMNL
jgi:hypothetical protein